MICKHRFASSGIQRLNDTDRLHSKVLGDFSVILDALLRIIDLCILKGKSDVK
jgi:hypothetical protein